jgi:hypothetical protein
LGQNIKGVLVGRTTGRPLETVSTDFTVVNGVLVSRSKATTTATNRRSADDSNGTSALATSPMSSEMDASAFTAIPSLSFVPPGSSGFVWNRSRESRGLP